MLICINKTCTATKTSKTAVYEQEDQHLCRLIFSMAFKILAKTYVVFFFKDAHWF